MPDDQNNQTHVWCIHHHQHNYRYDRFICFCCLSQSCELNLNKTNICAFSSWLACLLGFKPFLPVYWPHSEIWSTTNTDSLFTCRPWIFLYKKCLYLYIKFSLHCKYIFSPSSSFLDSFFGRWTFSHHVIPTPTPTAPVWLFIVFLNVQIYLFIISWNMFLFQFSPQLGHLPFFKGRQTISPSVHM